MLVFLFYYASVFDFPKYKKRFYCFMLWQKKKTKKVLPSLKCQNFSPKNSQIWCEIGVITFPSCSGTPAGQTIQIKKKAKFENESVCWARANDWPLY